MKISVLTVFSELYDTFLRTSLVGRAQEQQKISFDVTSFFSYVPAKARIDAPAFGPGAGMLIKPAVVQAAVEDKEATHGSAYKIFFSPQGRKLDQTVIQEIVHAALARGHLLLLPARYEGMDTRVESYYADEVVSVGDYVVMGGDLPAMLFLEALLRLIPGIVGKAASVERDSFWGPFVDYPEYTKPLVWKGMQVPEVIRSGNHAAIEQWRMAQAAFRTVREHFSWLRSNRLTIGQKMLCAPYIPSHYIAIMHTDVLVGADESEGTTSVTTIDIHDSARSSKTYGVKNMFVVTPLKDQQEIVQMLLDFWHTPSRYGHNHSRSQAIDLVRLAPTLSEVIAAIRDQEGAIPLVVATSARDVEHASMINWGDQKKVWASGRPILFVFGTGKGLTSSIIHEADFLLDPIEGFSTFAHLSVRSAVGIALDRWLGIIPKT